MRKLFDDHLTGLITKKKKIVPLEIKFLIPSYKSQMTTMTKPELLNDQNAITEKQKLAEFVQLIAEIIVDMTFAEIEEKNLLKKQSEK